MVLEKKPTPDLQLEALRRAGHQLQGALKKEKTADVFVQKNLTGNSEAAPSTLAEGLFLTAYEFAGYKTDEKSRAAAALTRLTLVGDAATPAQVNELQHLLEGVLFARDLVNAPLNKLKCRGSWPSDLAEGRRRGQATPPKSWIWPASRACAWAACWP